MLCYDMFVGLDNEAIERGKSRERERERLIIVKLRMSKEQRVYLGAKVPDDFHIFSFLANAWSSC